MTTTSRQIAASDVSPLADFPGYIANNWYTGAHFGNFVSGAAPGSGSIRLYPAFVKETITISALGLRVATLSAGGNVQAAIYANNPATMRPTGSPLVSTGSMSTTSAGSVNAAASVQLQPGMYWFATNCDNGTAAFTAANTNSAFLSWTIGSASQGNDMSNGAGLSGLSVAQTFGTWPDLTSASFTELGSVTTVPVVQFKVASVP